MSSTASAPGLTNVELSPHLSFLMSSVPRQSTLLWISFDHTGEDDGSLADKRVWLLRDEQDNFVYTTDPGRTKSLTASRWKALGVENPPNAPITKSARIGMANDEEMNEYEKAAFESVFNVNWVATQGGSGSTGLSWGDLRVPSLYKYTDPSNDSSRLIIDDSFSRATTLKDSQAHALPSTEGDDGELNRGYQLALLKRMEDAVKDAAEAKAVKAVKAASRRSPRSLGAGGCGFVRKC